MPSFTIHLVVPILALLALRFNPRLVLLLAPFTLLPDIDYFAILPEPFWVHRATLHNLFVPAIPLGMLAWSHRTGQWRRHREALLIVGLYLASHVVMDAFVGGVLPLWPLLNWTARSHLYIDVDTSTNTPTVHSGADVMEGAPTVTEVYPWLDIDETAMLVFVSLIFLASGLGWFNRWRGSHGRDDEAGDESGSEGTERPADEARP